MAQKLDDVADPAERARLETDADIAAREGSWSWRSITAVGVVLVLVFGGVAWGTIASIRADEATATARGAEWAYIGGPDLGVGGTYVYTRCEGSRRLYLTVGGDGFPVGPVQVVDALHGAGCDRP